MRVTDRGSLINNGVPIMLNATRQFISETLFTQLESVASATEGVIQAEKALLHRVFANISTKTARALWGLLAAYVAGIFLSTVFVVGLTLILTDVLHNPQSLTILGAIFGTCLATASIAVYFVNDALREIHSNIELLLLHQAKPTSHHVNGELSL